MMTHAGDIAPQDRVAGLRTALRILGAVWAYTDEEIAMIFDATVDEIQAWREAPSTAHISDDQLVRISYILGIHKALDTLVPERSAHSGFLRRPTPALDGASPVDIMREGTSGLRQIRRWLDGACQW